MIHATTPTCIHCGKYGEKCLPDDVEKIFGYAGERHAHVTYKDMVKTIDELF